MKDHHLSIGLWMTAVFILGLYIGGRLELARAVNRVLKSRADDKKK